MAIAGRYGGDPAPIGNIVLAVLIFPACDDRAVCFQKDNPIPVVPHVGHIRPIVRGGAADLHDRMIRFQTAQLAEKSGHVPPGGELLAGAFGL